MDMTTFRVAGGRAVSSLQQAEDALCARASIKYLLGSTAQYCTQSSLRLEGVVQAQVVRGLTGPR